MKSHIVRSSALVAVALWIVPITLFAAHPPPPAGGT